LTFDPKSCDYSKKQAYVFVFRNNEAIKERVISHDVVVFDVRSFVGEEISGIRAKRVFII
jgi:hypothetical protein